jgi:hypothetical protein
VTRNYTKPRARGEPQPDRHVATRLFEAELGEVDRSAGAVGLSRSAFLRAVLLADADVCAVLRATIADLEGQLAASTARSASLAAQLTALHERHAREVAGLYGLLDRNSAYEAELRRQEKAMWSG